MKNVSDNILFSPQVFSDMKSYEFSSFVVRSIALHLGINSRTNRVFSVFKGDACKVYIITEANRCLTTVLYPDEY